MKAANQNQAFSDAYLSIPRIGSQNTKIRDQIIKECCISQSVFYFWLNGTTPIPPLAKRVINGIMPMQDTETELFPETEILPETENQDTEI